MTRQPLSIGNIGGIPIFADPDLHPDCIAVDTGDDKRTVFYFGDGEMREVRPWDPEDEDE